MSGRSGDPVVVHVSASLSVSRLTLLEGLLAVVLFAALARVTERRMDEFNAQELANTAWAFAQASQLDTQLFTVLARVA